MRSAPGSRRFPQFRRAELGEWLPGAGIGYRWEPGLGGFRKPGAGSSHVALRHPSFRAYADYMVTDPFREALARLLEEASRGVTAIMCAETRQRSFSAPGCGILATTGGCRRTSSRPEYDAAQQTP